MIQRHLSKAILRYAKQYPIIAVVGPRQSGKTTLAKTLFPTHTYISLENLDYRQAAAQDPRGFLIDIGPFVILDEVQRVPEIFPYLQEIVDNNPAHAQYILTGSSQFLLIENITQSLAGRIATFKLYPLTFTELSGYPHDDSYADVYQKKHRNRAIISQQDLYEMLLKGFFPRIHDKGIESYKWYENYVLTYVERDIRSLLNIKNLRTFEQFLKLVASQSGQLMNYTSLSSALGISVPTIKEWISIMEASGILFILPPYFENLSKRIVKTPKLYLVDPGLLCYLLSIRTIDHLKTHPLLGFIFETFIVSECFKRICNLGDIPQLYFWRDQSGNEIDLLKYDGLKTFPLEIKLSQSYHPDFALTIARWLELKGCRADSGAVLYCGEHALHTQAKVQTIPWYYV